jgi:hypothetical protein
MNNLVLGKCIRSSRRTREFSKSLGLLYPLLNGPGQATLCKSCEADPARFSSVESLSHVEKRQLLDALPTNALLQGGGIPTIGLARVGLHL